MQLAKPATMKKQTLMIFWKDTQGHIGVRSDGSLGIYAGECPASTAFEERVNHPEMYIDKDSPSYNSNVVLPHLKSYLEYETLNVVSLLINGEKFSGNKLRNLLLNL